MVLAAQWGKKSSHHCMSALASRLSVMWWCIFFTVLLRSIKRRVNILPGRTTLDMNPSFPTRDLSWRFVHVRLFLHFWRMVMQSSYFSGGTSILVSLELMVMPRYIN